MVSRHFSSYGNDERGAITVEFVVISFALLMLVFFIVELTLLYFFIQSSQKAAHMGARVAIVSDSAATGLPAVNGLTDGEIFGTPCSLDPSPCTGADDDDGTGPWECVGGEAGCEAVPFTRIVDRMKNFMPGLEEEHVTIAYSYQGLGYAGGPFIPAVTVTIHDVPYSSGILGTVLGSAIDFIPDVSVTLTGEDLNTGGA